MVNLDKILVRSYQDRPKDLGKTLSRYTKRSWLDLKKTDQENFLTALDKMLTNLDYTYYLF